MGKGTAIATLVVGGLIFLVGIIGQAFVGRRFFKTPSAGDKHTTRLVLRLAALIIGAWLVIIATVAILHSHSHVQHAFNYGLHPAFNYARPGLALGV